MTLMRIISLLLLVTVTQLAYGDEDSSHALLTEIHSTEVRHIMRKLNVLLFEREHTQLELQRLRRQQLSLLVEETESLSRTAGDISLIDSLKKLSEEQQAMFKSMANELNDVARQLSAADVNGHEHDIETAYIRLQETCNTCHKLFRAW
ncbi:MAG: cytochrome c [Gammaproteobacteria bacterium]